MTPASRSGHNGNLTNTVELAERLGMLPGLVPGDTGLDSTTDSALVAELIAHEYAAEGRSDGRDLERALLEVLPQLAGGFSFVLMDEAHLIGVRDPHGFWPLVLGRVEGGWVLASETAALDIVGAHFVREVEPGEMIVIDASGVRTDRFAEPDPKLCLFEFVYFARPDTTLYGQSVHAARQRMGEELARQAPVDADMVMPVPESGIPAAQGYARAAGIPYGDGLVKNRYVGRTFIQPNQKQRGAGRAAEAQPAPREHPRQEARRGRRLDRARHHHPSGRADAARGGRRRGALPRVVAAVPVAVLLRHGHRRAGRSCSPPTCRWARSATTSASTRSPTSSSTVSPPRPARRPTRSAPPASRATTRCRCPLTTPSSLLEDDVRRPAPAAAR